MNKIIALTSSSWLIKAGTSQSGLLFKRIDDYLFISPTKRLEFKTMDDVAVKFGELKEENIIGDSIDEISNISGFPVKHPDITIINDNPPQYTKGSNVIFVAGYWGIEYPHGWTLAFCPKLKTTEEHKTSGPYKNRMEALNALAALTNRRNIEERRNAT